MRLAARLLIHITSNAVDPVKGSMMTTYIQKSVAITKCASSVALLTFNCTKLELNIVCVTRSIGAAKIVDGSIYR